MATLGSLIITLEANTANFVSALTKAEYAAKKSADAIKGAFIGLGTALAAAFSVHEMLSAVEAVAKYEGQLLKMAGRLNTSVETLSSFGVMMRKTGMDTDAFYTTLTRLEKGISAAAKKGEEGKEIIDEEGNVVLKTAKAYDELGLKAEVLNKLPLDQQLMAIAEAFKKNIDPADRVRVAMEIGGKSAAGLVNIFKGGASDIEKWIKQQKELGIVTEDAAKRATEFNNAVADLSAQWATLKRELAEGVIPALIELLRLMNDAIKTWKEFRESHVGQYAPYTPPKAPTVTRIAPESAVGVPQMGPMGLQLPPVTPVPPGVFKPPTRSGIGAGKGGGGGAGDMGLDRMRSIIDTLQKDLSRLTEGSLAEIREWANHTRNEIEKVGRKGAETEEAMRLVATVEGKKKEKAVEDYYLFVAKESGDNYKQIESDAKEWLTKYKGFADAETNINAIKNRKIWEEDNRQATERLSLRASLMSSIASEMPYPHNLQ